jgi:hypothetical protein
MVHFHSLNRPLDNASAIFADAQHLPTRSLID